MSFLKILKDEKVISKNVSKNKELILPNKSEMLNEEEETPESILRRAGYKIKLVTRTSFGVQIDFAKKYDEKEIEKTLSDFSIKIKNNSVFIII